MLKFVKINSDIIIAVVLGTVIRLVYIVSDEVWFDEAFTGVLLRVPTSEYFKVLFTDAHPPLYNLLMKPWAMLFGTGELSLRFLPFVFGIATIILAYKVTLQLLSKNAATLTAVLIAINPFLIGYSYEARSYSFYGFVTLLTFYFLIKKRYWLLVVGIIVMEVTHYMSFMFIVAMGLYYVFLHYKEKNLVKGLLRLSPVAVLPAIVAVYLLRIPKESLNTGWIRPSEFYNIPRSLIAYVYGVQTKLTGMDSINNVKLLFLNEYSLGIAFLLFLIAGIALAFYKLKSKKSELEKLVLLISMILIPQTLLIAVGLVEKQSLYVERYLAPATIFFVILISYVLTTVASFEVLAIILLVYAFTLTKIQKPNYIDGMKELVQTYKNTKREIVFTSPIDYLVGRYYFGEENDNIRLFNIKDPNESFAHWPLMKPDAKPNDLDNALIVSPDESRIAQGYRYVSESGKYRVYIKISQSQQ